VIVLSVSTERLLQNYFSRKYTKIHQKVLDKIVVEIKAEFKNNEILKALDSELYSGVSAEGLEATISIKLGEFTKRVKEHIQLQEDEIRK